MNEHAHKVLFEISSMYEVMESPHQKILQKVVLTHEGTGCRHPLKEVISYLTDILITGVADNQTKINIIKNAPYLEPLMFIEDKVPHSVFFYMLNDLLEGKGCYKAFDHRAKFVESVGDWK